MGIKGWAGKSAYRIGLRLAERRKADAPHYRPPDLALFGLGRSGTSLLMAMLHAHPDVTIVPDTRVLRSLVRRLPEGILQTWKRHRAARTQPLNAYEIFSRVLESRVSTPTRLIGEKTPAHIEYALIMGALWPEMRFVEIRRDPRAILASRQKAEWSSNRTLFKHLVAMRTHWQLGHVAEEVLNGRYHVVSYEDLLRSPDSELERLCTFLGIQPTPQMLRFHESSSHLVRDEEQQWKGKILTPLDPSRARAGHSELTQPDAAALSATFSRRPSPLTGRRPDLQAICARVLAGVLSLFIVALSVVLIVPVFDEATVEDLNVV